MKRRITNAALVQAKNALRPFFNSKKKPPRWQQFQEIRRNLPIPSFPELYKLSELNPAYHFDGLGGAFPKEPIAIPDVSLSRLTPLSLTRELQVQIHRINHHSDALRSAVEDFADINDRIFNEDWYEASKRLSETTDKHGISLYIAKKELLVALHHGGISALSKRYKALTANSDRRAWGLLCRIMYDMTDPAFHPSKSARDWLSASIDYGPERDWYIKILRGELFQHVDKPSDFANTTLRYNGTTLIDILFYLWKCRSLLDPRTSYTQIIDQIDDHLLSTLQSRFSNTQFMVPSVYRLEDSTPSDIEIFRTSYFHDEITNINRWRFEINKLLYQDLGMSQTTPDFLRPSPLDKASLEMLDSAGGIARAGALIETWADAPLRHPQASGDHTFITSVVIGQTLRKFGEGIPIDEEHVVALISLAEDLQDYIDKSSLNKILEDQQVRSLPLLEFVIRDLLFRSSRSQDNDLDRRAAFMALFTGSGRSGIVSYFENIYSWNKQTALHLARVCSRPFLERLYLLMTSVKDVIETRIEVCSWLLSKDEGATDPLLEEKDALERELSNLDARSDLDSTRVHVDEDSLREWFSETQYPKVSRYVQTVLAEGQYARHGTLLAFYNKLRLRDPSEVENEDFLRETQIGSEFVILDVVESTLKAFVSDKTFGLDAYLSRRIRHGTLSGFLLTPISRLVKKVREAIEEDERPDAKTSLTYVADMFESWRQEVSSTLDFARKNLIQIRSGTKPDGLIEATWRTTSNVTHVDAMIARARTRVLDAKGDYGIFPDVYSLCWDLLERDLAQVRLYLLREFSKKMIDSLADRYGELTPSQRSKAFPYMTEAHQLFEGRVLEVCGWFIRPVFRRDSYDLRTLIESTVSIVRELDVSYDFVENITVDENIEINRGSFELIGDILFVLIGNAAKHGKRGADIEIIAARKGDIDFVQLDVTSTTDDKAAFDKSLDRITKAYNIDPSIVDSAAVDEGFSGIRKVVGLIKKTKTKKSIFGIFKDEKSLSLTFSVLVPTGVTFRKERA